MIIDDWLRDLSADFNAIAVDYLLDIHKYLMKKMTQYKIFGFIRKVIVLAITLFSCNALECVSMNNHECKARPEVIAINSNVPLFYPYSIKINKCSGSCNNINDPYAKLRVPHDFKGINIKVFNLMSITNDI